MLSSFDSEYTGTPHVYPVEEIQTLTPISASIKHRGWDPQCCSRCWCRAPHLPHAGLSSSWFWNTHPSWASGWGLKTPIGSSSWHHRLELWETPEDVTKFHSLIYRFDQQLALRPAAQTYTTCYKHATVRKSRKVVKKRFNKKIQEDRPDSTAITQAYWLSLFYTQLCPCVQLCLYPSSLFLSASPFPCTFLYQFGHSNQITSLDPQAGILMDCKIHAGPLWRDSCSSMMAYQFV